MTTSLANTYAYTQRSVKLEATTTVNCQPENVITNSNSLYDELQEVLDSKNRNLWEINNKAIEFMCYDNENVKSTYNTSGNLSLKLHIPTPSQDKIYPNYLEAILNAQTDDTSEIMQILTDWIKDDEMLTYWYAPTGLVGINAVPLINMKEVIQKQSKDTSDNLGDNSIILKWWNVGREGWVVGEDRTQAEFICNYYATQFNALIDYIITNDLIIPDDTFKSKLLALFSNGVIKSNQAEKQAANQNLSTSNYAIYPHANGTLMLPSLVNYVADKTNKSQHALSYCGYVNVGQRMFISQATNEANLSKERMFIAKDENGNISDVDEGEKWIYPNSCAEFNINGYLNGRGDYNYPLSGNKLAHEPPTMALYPSKESVKKLLSDDIFEKTEVRKKSDSITEETVKVKKFPKETKTIFVNRINTSNGTVGKGTEKIVEVYEHNEEDFNRYIIGQTLYGTIKTNVECPGGWIRCKKTTRIRVPIAFYLTKLDGCRIKDDWQNWDYRRGSSNCKNWGGYWYYTNPCHGWLCTTWCWAEGAKGDRSIEVYDIYNTVRNDTVFLDWLKEALWKQDMPEINGNGEDGLVIPVKDIMFEGLEMHKFNIKNDEFSGPDGEKWKTGKRLANIGDHTIYYNESTRDYSLDERGANCHADIQRPNQATIAYSSTSSRNVDTINSRGLIYDSNWRSMNNFICVDGPVPKMLKQGDNYSTAYGVDFDLTYWINYKIPANTWTKKAVEMFGSYGSEVSFDGSKNNTPRVFARTQDYQTALRSKIQYLPYLMTMRQTTKQIYLFNDNVFNYWVRSVISKHGQLCILNGLRKYIHKHLELVLLNKACKKMESLVEKIYEKGDLTDLSFVNIPLGPPMLYVDNSKLLDNKTYYASYTMVNNSRYNVYSQSAHNVNIVNYIRSIAETEYKGSYLDLLLSEMISKGQISGALNDDVYFSILIPEAGLDILNILTPSITGLLDRGYTVQVDRWSNGNNGLAYNMDIPKILVSFKKLSDADKAIQALNTSYNYITSVLVPYMCLHHERDSNWIEVRIKTLTPNGYIQENGDVANAEMKQVDTEPVKLKEVADKYNADDGITDEEANSGGESNNNNSGAETFKPHKQRKSYTKPTNGVQHMKETFEKSNFVGTCEEPTTNTMYIYVSFDKGFDYMSAIVGNGSENRNEKNNRCNPMLQIAYLGKDSQYPSKCLRPRKP